MHYQYYIFTEEKSMVYFLEGLPLFKNHDIKFIDFQGKQDLLKNIKKRIRSLEKCHNSDSNSTTSFQYIILIDQDRNDCKNLKKRFQKILQGLTHQICKSGCWCELYVEN